MVYGSPGRSTCSDTRPALGNAAAAAAAPPRTGDGELDGVHRPPVFEDVSLDAASASGERGARRGCFLLEDRRRKSARGRVRTAHRRTGLPFVLRAVADRRAGCMSRWSRVCLASLHAGRREYMLAKGVAGELSIAYLSSSLELVYQARSQSEFNSLACAWQSVYRERSTICSYRHLTSDPQSECYGELRWGVGVGRNGCGQRRLDAAGAGRSRRSRRVIPTEVRGENGITFSNVARGSEGRGRGRVARRAGRRDGTRGAGAPWLSRPEHRRASPTD